MLGVCHKLGAKLGIDPLLFQIIFILWFISNPIALLWYIGLAFLL